ncbi:PepSY domain-containing protein [Mesonia ostreae]|uniref:PepSY domain-containing protein n=1 Tax=Mesonia ostreae TaxID=861110 RepID=A0ABU2KID4_9FLAO|nr:PepSY domain-containing protein [Mesonia ostreae]MDT0294447.1 PepSY domain-containing protein [Mesonia ostreae]
MSLSFWRYSHLALAISSFAFLILASLTGIVLALEPINIQAQDYSSNQLDEISLAEALQNLNKEHDEVLWVEVDRNDVFTASVINEAGDNQVLYIQPETGKSLGEKQDSHPVFQFAKTLHRSLFLKSVGRFFIGLVAFLLCFIVLSGIALTINRQGGFKNFFSPIIKDSFYPYFHVVFGRWLLIPIFIISLSGVYLSLQQFSIIPQLKVEQNFDSETLEEHSQEELADFSVFQDHSLADLRRLEFPFSPFPEDYFTLQLQQKEVIVNQFNGEIISSYEYPFSSLITYYSFKLHTGEGSIIWSVVLLLASIGILFFIFSGFKIMWKRRRSRIRNHYKKEVCNYVILVGSEGGTTLSFANALYAELIRLGKKVFIAEMSAYQNFPAMQHLIVMTATYGNGEAPANAKNFDTLLEKYPQQRNFNYAILGFGSRSYPDFCAFAYQTETLLYQLKEAQESYPITCINNQSTEAFTQWMLAWGKREQLPLRVPKNILQPRKLQQHQLVCSEKISPDKSLENTFLIQLKSNQKLKFKSGDLLSIVAKEDDRERLYSIGKLNKNEMILAVKRREKGVVSNLLHQLNESQSISAGIVKNKAFHLPKRSKQVIMIATGTGIGPFLGMMIQNKHKDLHLYWGGRTRETFSPYTDHVENALTDKKLTSLKLAFSREEQEEKTYVQELLMQDAVFIAEALKNKTVFMICGSIVMQEAVLHALNKIGLIHNQKALCYYEHRKQLKIDCY